MRQGGREGESTHYQKVELTGIEPVASCMPCKRSPI